MPTSVHLSAPPKQFSKVRQRPDLIPWLAIVCVWAGMAACVGIVGDFPLNDDWVYALAVKSVLETGRFQFPSATSANVGPQIYWGALFCWPFGFSFTALRLSSLALGLVGALALYAIVQRLSGSRWTAFTAAMVLAVNPFYFSLANTFMTDVPFIALTLVAMNFLMQWLQLGSRASLAIGLTAAFAAILVRQFAIVIVVAFVVADVVKHGASISRLLNGAALVAFAVALHFGYQRWLVTTGRTPLLSIHADVHTLVPSSTNVFSMLKMSTSALLYTGFLVLPFVAKFTGGTTALPAQATNATRIWRLRLVCCFAACAVLAALWRMDKLMPASGNVLIRSGIGPRTLFDTYILHVNLPAVPAVVSGSWAVLTLLSILAAMRAAHWIASHFRRSFMSAMRAGLWPVMWPACFLLSLGLAYFLILVIVTGSVYIFDRYFLFFLPVVVALVADAKAKPSTKSSRLGTTLTAVLLVLYAAFSVAATHDYLSWNRTRWQVLQELTGKGVSSNELDGGYEFNGWTAYDPAYQEQAGKSWWWVQDNKYIVAAGPLPGYAEVGSRAVDRWLPFGEGRILTLKRVHHGP